MEGLDPAVDQGRSRRDASVPHIAPALLLSIVATAFTVLWLLAGPREAWLNVMYGILIVGLAVFVINAIYVLFRFGNPFRSAPNRKIWAVAIAAGLPFFVLFWVSLSVIAVTTINVTNATSSVIDGLVVTYPGSQTNTFDLDPGQTRTLHVAPNNEGEAVLTGGGVEGQSDFILECCASTVDFVIE